MAGHRCVICHDDRHVNIGRGGGTPTVQHLLQKRENWHSITFSGSIFRAKHQLEKGRASVVPPEEQHILLPEFDWWLAEAGLQGRRHRGTEGRQWEFSFFAKRSTSAWPKVHHIELTAWGWSLHSPGKVLHVTTCLLLRLRRTTLTERRFVCAHRRRRLVNLCRGRDLRPP